MKKLTSILLALVLSLSLAACGGGGDTTSSTGSGTAAPAASAAAPAAPAQTGCSDENWAALQEMYSAALGLHSAVGTAYNEGQLEMSDDDVEGMIKMADYLQQIGAADQSTWDDETVVNLTNALDDFCATMVPYAEALSTGEAAGGASAGCSDENWADLQAMYSVAVDLHSVVATAYNEGMIEMSDANVEGMIKMADYLQQIAAADQSTWDDETVVNLTNALDEFCATMVPYADALAG